jgi:hypothetical protein
VVDLRYRRTARAAFHALPYHQSPLPRPTNAGLRCAAKSSLHN